MKEQIHIRTYDSIATDLAGEMREWREFVAGEAYSVRLRDSDSGDEVLVWMSADSDDIPAVIVEGLPRSALLDRALGRVIQALSEHSDNLMVDRRTIADQTAAPNGGPGKVAGSALVTEGRHR